MSTSRGEDKDKYPTQLGGQSDDDDSDDDDEVTFPYSSTDSESGDDDDDGDEGARPPPPPFQHNFAPPFYGRPPTPLPPSPSLTSLLRPSRPTTPDASDDEQPLKPVPRATPKVPTYEYYGFVVYVFSTLAFLMYLLWSFLPSPFLHALGIYYYPNRWWSLAVPSFLVMLLVYVYVALASYNLEVLTLPLHSLETVVDEAGKVAAVDSRGRIKGLNKDRDRDYRDHRDHHKDRGGGGRSGSCRVQHSNKKKADDAAAGPERRKRAVGGAGPTNLDWKSIWNVGTDAVMDVPLAGVCEVLYGDGAGMPDGHTNSAY